MALITCKNCGNQISDKARFCPKCGDSVNDAESANTDIVQSSDNSNDYSSIPPIPEPPRKNKSLVITLIICGIVLVLGVVGYIVYNSSRNKALAEMQEKARLDSIAVAELEQARLDSIREDSLLKAHKESLTLKADIVCEAIAADGFSRLLTIRSDAKIIASLKSIGFTVVSQRTEYRSGECGDETVRQDTITVLSRDDDGTLTNVTLDPGALFVEINFGSATDLQRFIDTAIKMGYKKNGDTLNDPSDCYWAGSDIEISGNSVKIVSRFEC